MNQNNSTFITVLSWILIVFSGFGFLFNILQNIILNTVIPIETYEVTDKDSTLNFLDFMALNFRLIFALAGIMILFFFISSIALLKRKKWSRISIIILFLLAITCVILITVLNLLAINGFDVSSSNNPESFGIVLSSIMIIFALVFIILFLWLIKKLTSEKIKSEFTNVPQQRV